MIFLFWVFKMYVTSKWTHWFLDTNGKVHLRFVALTTFQVNFSVGMKLIVLSSFKCLRVSWINAFSVEIKLLNLQSPQNSFAWEFLASCFKKFQQTRHFYCPEVAHFHPGIIMGIQYSQLISLQPQTMNHSM